MKVHAKQLNADDICTVTHHVSMFTLADDTYVAEASDFTGKPICGRIKVRAPYEWGFWLVDDAGEPALFGLSSVVNDGTVDNEELYREYVAQTPHAPHDDWTPGAFKDLKVRIYND